MKNRRVGLLGGTFDPPHFGHVKLAVAAREQLALGTVLFLPVGNPPHKQNKRVTAVSHRIHMVRLAIASRPYCQLDEIDIHRPLPHNTATLLPLLRQSYPNALFWFIIGADSLRDFPTWDDPERIIAQCRLAVLPRQDILLKWHELQQRVPHIETAVDFLKPPQYHVSSTAIRQRVRNGEPIDEMVGTAVAAYIREQRLYDKP